jgi:hypothetical protein
MAVLGERVEPPQAMFPTEDNRVHTITGALALTFPSDFRAGALSPLIRDLGGFVRFLFASGLHYTRVRNSGSGTMAPFGWTGAGRVEPLNASTMPWIQELDLRVTKGLRFGAMHWTLYADVRNLLNLTTLTRVFSETGGVTNEEFRRQEIEPEVWRLLGAATEAQKVTELDGSVTVVLPNDCGEWYEGPVDCVLLKRAEQRWGNGDGRYAEQEYMSALNGWYEAWNAPTWWFYAPGRQMRVGLQLQF